MSDQSRVLSGRYRVDDVIGRGGMATVHRGYDLTLGRSVAIKILDPSLARDNVFRTRFRMEAQAASRMNNPTIVRVFDAGEHDEDGTIVPYIVMELVSGRTLKTVIAAGAVPIADAARYVDGILQALEYSHRAGVVHRDIKPGNVMITDDGGVKVMDFGIARAVSDSSSTVAETTSIIGTAAYFSPEQAKGEPVDARTDLYSTGVVLYELLTGRQPFRGETPVAVAYQHVSEPPTAPSEVEPSVPRAFDAVVLRALAKDPFARFPDAATFRQAVTGAQEGREPTKRQLENLTNELYGSNPRAAAETARALRQLSSDTTMTRTQQGPPVAWIWAGVALIAVVLISVVVWVVGATRSMPDVSETTTSVVPDVTDDSFAKAEERLKPLGVEITRVDETSNTVEKDDVISTSPEAGTAIKKGDKIAVHVSTGVEQTEVPAITGLDEKAARAAIKAAGLSVGRVDRINDPRLPAGQVIAAGDRNGDVKAGDKLAKASVINLTVATGMISVGDYRGRAPETAQTELGNPDTMGLKVEASSTGACDASVKPVDAGQKQIITSQSPGAGDVPIGSTITLKFCDVP